MPRTMYKTVDGLGRCLVMSMSSDYLTKNIPVRDVGKRRCKHNGAKSDCRRCWDCGVSMGVVYVDSVYAELAKELRRRKRELRH